MTILTLDQAKAVFTASLPKRREMNLKPLSVAVLDGGGHLIACQRQDDAFTLRPQIAAAKASGALALGIFSSKIADIAQEGPTFVAALGSISAAQIVPAMGGVLVVDATGKTIGAVGVAGDTSDSDEAHVLAGLAAISLAAQS